MSDAPGYDRYKPPGEQPVTPPATPIIYSVAASPPPAVKPGPAAKPEEPQYEEVRSAVRETLETISFVVFLVLMLKAFVAEAYVIPTGSMATTLLGDHINLECPRCGQTFTANASNNAREIQHEEKDGKNTLRTEVSCPNCRHQVRNPENRSVYTGDKVLVLKPVFDMFKAQRHDVVVFKYPGGPQEEFTAKNYIKRLWGLPGEKLAIWGGDIFLVNKQADGSEKLEKLRKAPDKMLRMRRLVNDNDRNAPKHGEPWPTSWHPLDDLLAAPASTPWKAESDGKVWTTQPAAGTAWLRYQHRFTPTAGVGFAGERPNVMEPHLITDFLAYNSNGPNAFPHDWVGDLLIEAEIDVQASTGKCILELNKGVLCARASFDLQNGKCTVVLLNQGKEVLKKEADTKVHSTGKHRLRFANFDDRLTVWVGNKLPFEEGIPFTLKAEESGPRLSDFLPASVGVENAKISVTHLSLWRDIYYTQHAEASAEALVSGEALVMTPEDYRRQLASAGAGNAGDMAHTVKRAVWRPYYSPQVVVGDIGGSYAGPMYYPKVTTDHPSDRFNADEYFMLGDNSLQSLDSRNWGQVPERMLLGRAIWVYWPYNSFSSIR